MNITKTVIVVCIGAACSVMGEETSEESGSFPISADKGLYVEKIIEKDSL